MFEQLDFPTKSVFVFDRGYEGYAFTEKSDRYIHKHFKNLY